MMLRKMNWFLSYTNNRIKLHTTECDLESHHHTFLSCQDDSEDGELSRRLTEELLMEVEPVTEDGEHGVQHTKGTACCIQLVKSAV